MVYCIEYNRKYHRPLKTGKINTTHEPKEVVLELKKSFPRGNQLSGEGREWGVVQ